MTQKIKSDLTIDRFVLRDTWPPRMFGQDCVSLHGNTYIYKTQIPDIMQISEAQNIVNDWIEKYGVRYFSELTNMAILTEEVGEVARIIARKYGDQSFKKTEENLDLGDEMADVLWVLICLANQTGVDLNKAFMKNMEKKTNRDKDRHRNNKKLK